ncbi:MAG: TolB family protein [Chloroflexota bacterium]
MSSLCFMLPPARATALAAVASLLLLPGAQILQHSPARALASIPLERIAFQRADSAGSHIVVADVDGSNAHILTTSPNGGIDDRPRFSPDGHTVAFARHTPIGDDIVDDEVYLIGTDGSGLHQLTRCELGVPPQVPRACGFSDPSFTPDGGSILLSHGWQAGIGQAVWSIRPDGTALRHITEEPGRRHREGPGDEEPAMSPDGEWIAFARCGLDGCAIALVNDHGGDLRILTDQSLLAEQPRWSPDGGTIVFRGAIDDTFNVMAMDPDGGNVRQLTFDTADTGASAAPRYSPDGRRIVFVHRTVGELRDLYVMDADGRNVTQLTHTEDAAEFQPDWAIVH